MLYIHKIFAKSVYVKYWRFGIAYTKKCIYLYAYENASSQKVYILTYALKRLPIKCIYLSAAAGRRYKQKVHTLYMLIYLYKKVYTLYIRIEIVNTGETLHQKCIKGFLPAEHLAKCQEHQVHQII